MAKTRVVFYQESSGDVPVLEWLESIGKRDKRIVAKCIAWIEELKDKGTTLDRPIAAYLRDGIYELRIRYQKVNYRILYFFSRDTHTIAILAHGLTKEKEVPDKDIDLAITRKAAFEKDPEVHSYEEN